MQSKLRFLQSQFRHAFLPKNLSASSGQEGDGRNQYDSINDGQLKQIVSRIYKSQGGANPVWESALSSLTK